MKNRRKLKVPRRAKVVRKAAKTSTKTAAVSAGDAQIERLPLARLQSMLTRVDAAIGEREKQEKADLRERFRVIAERAGFSLEDVMGGTPARKGKVPVKFRNPKDPSEAWSGRGRLPNWLRAKLKAGARLDQFRV